jgi:serralysin
MATKITIGETPINATYTAVTGTTSGAGTGAKFDVTKTNGVYTTVIQAAFLGTGYAAGDTITIAGANLGGVTGVNNDILTVATVGVGGKIATFGTVGTGRIGTGVNTTVIAIDGTTGVDTYVFNGKSTEFTVTNDLANKTIAAASLLDTTVTFKLADHERVVFSDKATAFDLTGSAGDVYALLKASFGGTVNTTYEGIGIKMEDAGTTSLGIADAIVNSPAFIKLNPDFPTFVNNVYTNVMGVAPTPTQASPYITALITGTTTQTALLNTAAHLATFQTTIGLIGVAPATTGILATSGIDYIPA